MSAGQGRVVRTALGGLHVEERGSGPAVICWPSLFADARSMDGVAEALAGAHRVLVVDPPAHGRSEGLERVVSLDECAGAAMEILDAFGVERAAWIGAAWGGHVGVAAAVGHAARLTGLVILNSPMTPWRGRRRALMRLTQALLAVFGPRSFVGRLVVDKSFAKDVPRREALVDEATAALGRCDRDTLGLALRSAMFARGDLVPQLGEVRVPALFFAGTEDDLFPVDEAREQAMAIPDVRFVPVERSAHHSAVERPEIVLPNLDRWITECSRIVGFERQPPKTKTISV